MPFTFTMPKLSPTMEEGAIAKWRKKEGEFVKAGDVLIEVATDKATVEHAVLDSGWLRKILIKEGESALVNQAVAIFTETKEESIEGYQPEGVNPKAEIPTPSQKAALTETEEKPTTTQPVSPSNAMHQPAFSPMPPLENYEFATPEGIPGARLSVSPYARRLAKEKGFDLTTVKGSGPQGRIMSRDLDKAQPAGIVAFGHREYPQLAPGSYDLENLSPMRKMIAQRLQESKTFIPHFYVSQEVRADALVQVREQLKEGEIKLSVNDFIIRACALALKESPQVNSGFNSVTSQIIRFKTVDISVAVSVEAGLITPIIRHADFKNLGQINVEVKQLAARAREGKLSREEYLGGSFTISNLGMFGISHFAGIINPPQAALLAVGGIEEKPVVTEGKIVPGKTLTLTLSADHRVIDGAEGAKFLKLVQKYLENPAILLV